MGNLLRRLSILSPVVALTVACSSGSTTSGAAVDAAAGGSSTASSGAGGSAGTSTTGTSGQTASGTTGAATSSSSGQGASGTTGGSSSGSTSSSSGGDGGAVDENAWLDPMNAARMAVGAAPLTWNPIAAQVAEAWASGCSFNHNPNAKSEYDAMGGSGGLGENIAAGAPTQTIAGAVGSWTAEEMYYDHATNTCSAPANASCGHYTQIVWSTTTTVGCAQVHCTTNSPFTKFTEWDYSVCDFSPPGNINNQPPY